jgi:hypothetical protein
MRNVTWKNWFQKRDEGTLVVQVSLITNDGRSVACYGGIQPETHYFRPIAYYGVVRARAKASRQFVQGFAHRSLRIRGLLLHKRKKIFE